MQTTSKSLNSAAIAVLCKLTLPRHTPIKIADRANHGAVHVKQPNADDPQVACPNVWSVFDVMFPL